jgi:hypothetical protein
MGDAVSIPIPGISPTPSSQSGDSLDLKDTIVEAKKERQQQMP